MLEAFVILLIAGHVAWGIAYAVKCRAAAMLARLAREAGALPSDIDTIYSGMLANHSLETW